MAVYRVVIPKKPTVKDLAAILSLMSITVENGDPTCDIFIEDYPHLVQEITDEKIIS